jgi:hypothetical protein
MWPSTHKASASAPLERVQQPTSPQITPLIRMWPSTTPQTSAHQEQKEQKEMKEDDEDNIDAEYDDETISELLDEMDA